MNGPDEWRDLSDYDAERAVLAACMESPAAVADIFDRLAGVEDFADPRHRVIFGAIIELAGRGDPTDPVALKSRLEEIGKLRRAGGLPYLAEVHGALVAVGQGEYHAGVVAERAERRRAYETFVRGAQALGNIEVPVGETLNRVATELEGAAHPDRPVHAPGRSWAPVDLGPVLRGEHAPAVPSVGIARSDGVRLLYPGKEHSVIGEMESGKSWFGAACCASELVAGNHVLYVHFEEADPADTVGRLQSLGVPDKAIIELFRFVGPDEPVRPSLLEALLTPAPSLVVLDGVNEAMALHGHEIRQEDGAAAFRRLLVKPCTAVGAAVLTADHVVKDKERRDRGPLGSVHKGNAINGSLLLLENAEPFGRGQKGRSHVFVTKDRPGHLRKGGRATKTPGKTFVGELVVDDTRMYHDYLDLTLWAPRDDEQDAMVAAGPHEEVDEIVLAVVADLTAAGHAATGRAVRANSPFGTDRTADALERLVIDGKAVKTPGPRGATIFTPSTAPDASSKEMAPEDVTGPARPAP